MRERQITEIKEQGRVFLSNSWLVKFQSENDGRVDVGSRVVDGRPVPAVGLWHHRLARTADVVAAAGMALERAHRRKATAELFGGHAAQL